MGKRGRARDRVFRTRKQPWEKKEAFEAELLKEIIAPPKRKKK